MAVRETLWPPMAIRLLVTIAARSPDQTPICYEPASWFRQRASVRNRSRWSRWTRRLASAVLVRRVSEPSRDRVRHVGVTPSGRAWIDEHCGPGALSQLDCHWDQEQLRSTPHDVAQAGERHGASRRFP